MRGRPKKAMPAAPAAPVTIPPFRELEGFRVFDPGENKKGMSERIGLWIGRDLIRLTSGTSIALGEPDHVLVFFDELRRRMMLQPAEGTEKNAIRITVKTRRRRTVIQRKALHKEILRISGKDITAGTLWLPGHAADTVRPSLIFCLDDMEEKE